MIMARHCAGPQGSIGKPLDLMWTRRPSSTLAFLLGLTTGVPRNVEFVRINPNRGNGGIGTTAPITKFDLYGSPAPDFGLRDPNGGLRLTTQGG